MWFFVFLMLGWKLALNRKFLMSNSFPIFSKFYYFDAILIYKPNVIINYKYKPSMKQFNTMLKLVWNWTFLFDNLWSALKMWLLAGRSFWHQVDSYSVPHSVPGTNNFIQILFNGYNLIFYCFGIICTGFEIYVGLATCLGFYSKSRWD